MIVAGVRSIYIDGMIRIVVAPTWSKVFDFETTLPSAVGNLPWRAVNFETDTFRNR